jgi:hypothetical protein
MTEPYADVREHFTGVEGVKVNSGRGSQGLKVKGKMFAMFYKGDLLVQLAPLRVQQVIDAGEGLAFDPGTGKAMADRVLIPESKKESWIRFCEESKRFAESR